MNKTLVKEDTVAAARVSICTGNQEPKGRRELKATEEAED